MQGLLHQQKIEDLLSEFRKEMLIIVTARLDRCDAHKTNIDRILEELSNEAEFIFERIKLRKMKKWIEQHPAAITKHMVPVFDSMGNIKKLYLVDENIEENPGLTCLRSEEMRAILLK